MMGSAKFLCLLVASNFVSLTVTTLAVLYAWKSSTFSSSESESETGFLAGDAFDQEEDAASSRNLQSNCCTCNSGRITGDSFTCPAGEGFLNLDASIAGTTIQVEVSDRLCTLSVMFPESLKPIGRSYNGNDWEPTAGEFATLTWSCSGTACTVILPEITSDSSFSYQLKSFDAPELYSKEKDEISRFLEQATFGPTRAEIAAFDNNLSNLPQAFANYIKTQQTAVPLTSHRAMFRRRLNAQMETATDLGAVTHPCQAGTRYRRFAFSLKDSDKYVTISTIGNTNRKTLTIDGFVRTVVDGPITYRWDDSIVFEDGSYRIGRPYRGNTKLGYVTYLLAPSSNDYFEIAFGDFLGNPPIAFDSGVTPNKVVNLSSANAKPADTRYFKDDTVKVQELILTKDLTDAVCASIEQPNNPIDPVFAIFNGNYFIHDPRFIIIENTLENPAPDGGGRAVRTTANIVTPELAATCSNVPRTFLNEGTCKLSFDAQACAALTYDYNDNEIRPDFFIDMTPQNLRRMFEATADRPEGPMYIYVVEGLADRVREDKDLEPPCAQSTGSRFIPVPCSGAADNLDRTMHQIFSDLLFYNDDVNPNVRNVWNWHNLDCPAPVYQLTGFEVNSQGSCYKHVHPDHLNVYDFTYWTLPTTHPGNSKVRNPIKEFAEAGLTTLTFPDWHTMDRWSGNKDNFGQAGRLGDRVHYYDLPREMRTQEINDLFGFTPSALEYDDSTGVLVCGSPNEVANDPTLEGGQGRGAFDSLNWEFISTNEEELVQQKRIIWTAAALNAKDQLRQRVAWALSQILVVSPEAIDVNLETEAMTNYYDIFVRNAFGSYRDILKEVSYSPLMATMLTYHGSQSTQFVWSWSGNLEYADENYAREIMQLFTTGLYKLNPDGSQVIGSSGETVRVYTNFDIVEYARVWTGFDRSRKRGNIEGNFWSNYVDPMRINMDYRDLYPKMGLDLTYIGDGVPLCADLPKRHFLMKGATYRLLGVNPTPELVWDPINWAKEPAAKRMKLQPVGANSLFAKLCGSTNPSSCGSNAKVVLDQVVPCNGLECDVDTVRVVEVGNGRFYEYVQPPCVHQAFFDNPTLVVKRTDWWDLKCADPRTMVASAACCNTEEGEWLDEYWGERTTLETARQRCSTSQFPQLCSRWPRPNCDAGVDPAIGSYCENNAHFWTSTSCTLQAKIDGTGNVAIVHFVHPIGEEEIREEEVSELVRPGDAKTFFRVEWNSDPSQIINNCASMNKCFVTEDGMCACDVYVTNEQAFSQSRPPSRDDVLNLHIGAFDPASTGSVFQSSTSGGVTRYTQNGALTSESVFAVIDDNGIRHFRKNEKSTVHIAESNLSFRNPVHFISLTDRELRDAEHETDAALDHYFYHSNTAPFLAIRFAQRFGISNPSPRYIERIAAAFRKGSFTYNDGGSPIKYGSGNYGDLAAMVACVLLDREARSYILDADPIHGSMKEPLLKIIGLMRSMEFTVNDGHTFSDFDLDLDLKIGQMAHALPNVFSFFLPEYTPSGPVSQASLVAPEGQVTTGPKIIDTLNGLFSLVKYGLSPCYSGLAQDRWWLDNCWGNGDFVAGEYNAGTQGRLTYSPKEGSNAEDITDELAALLTGGRLSLASREMIDEVVNAEPNPALKVIKAQQLITLAPEFHSTNIVRKSGTKRPEPTVPPPSTRPYKAVVYVLLEGGVDSFNMLAPHRCTETNDNGQTLLEQYNSERTSLAINEEERSRVIDATGQPCDQFVIHQDLEIVERLYKSGDLAFFANAGVLNKPVDKNNYYEQTKTQLFAHNAMQEEAQKVDPFDGAPGTGVLGRMCEVLNQKGFHAQPITVDTASVATVGSPGSATDPLFVSPFAATKFDPRPDGETFDPRPYLDELNDAVDIQSSLYGETYSKRLQKALFDNEVLVKSLEVTQLNEQFADTDYSSKLKPVATLISSHQLRGTDRDVFFVSLSGWDNHEQLKAALTRNFQELNTALTTFYNEMISQGVWNSVSLVITSDFARTLTANSGDGSDHAWGGNYFMMGGAVKGGVIHGEYPSDITSAGPYNVGRGRLIPTMSWESILTSVCEWMGVDTEAELDQCLPNRRKTGTKLFTASEVFESTTRAASYNDAGSFWK